MAKQKLKGVQGVTFVESNAEHMAIENESQDVVTCNFVLSTMPVEAQVTVRICRITTGAGCDGSLSLSRALSSRWPSATHAGIRSKPPETTNKISRLARAFGLISKNASPHPLVVHPDLRLGAPADLSCFAS